jgi:uncharacterized protein (DUF2336 family)
MTDLAQLARHGDAGQRATVAAGAATPPELLLYLAADVTPAVRAAVAANPAAPAQAGLLLAHDAEEGVRQVLARRLGGLSPATGAGTRQARLVEAALGKLVEDAAVAVRTALAEAVAELPDAPRALVLRLARDAALPVAGPVLRGSPLLTDADLLGLVAAPPAAFTRRSIAMRPALSEAVSEAVAASADPPAIAALLANPSAALQEATLDRLAAGASAEPAWQPALARHPRLTPGALRNLAGAIAAHLVEVLAARPDLPEGVAELVQARIAERLAAARPGQALAEAAVQAGNRPALLDALEEATGLSRARLQAAVALRSPRVAAALCWRAGWTAVFAEAVQAALGVPRGKVVRANAEGGWTLTPGELHWQIELLDDLPG